MTNWLKRSYNFCNKIKVIEHLGESEFDIFETLTSRYARVIDILIHKVFRAIDAFELEEDGTILDVINRAHKRGLFHSVDEFRIMKDLRNDISHDMTAIP